MRLLLTIYKDCLRALAAFAGASFCVWPGNQRRFVGTVKDNSGAVVADASVEATNLGTGFKTTVKSNTGGEYHFVNLPGRPLFGEGSGGGLAGTIADVEVQLNHTVTANVIATPTSSTTTVEVNEQAASVDTMTAKSPIRLRQADAGSSDRFGWPGSTEPLAFECRCGIERRSWRRNWTVDFRSASAEQQLHD